MINTFYHRAQAPWVYQVENGEVEVMFRVGKKTIKEAWVTYGDALGLYLDGKWFSKTEKMSFLCETSHHDVFKAKMSHYTKRYRYAFDITFVDGSKVRIGEVGVLNEDQPINQEGNGFTFSYWNKANAINTPEWFKNTNWFQIFPDRFKRVGPKEERFADWSQIKPRMHELYGGNIEGIISALKYIKECGFSGLYLTPVFSSPSAHRYDTTEYNEIDPVLGDDKLFKQLVDEAHKIGLRVMLDAVYNHIGASSIYWQDVIKNKEKSKYKDWFWINDFSKIMQPNEYREKGIDFVKDYPYETFSFSVNMPRLNWNNPEVVKYLISASEKWTRMGIDGWRLDVSFEPSDEFWREFKKAVTKINPEIAIIGEVWWDSINFLKGDMWHGVMNYPLRKVIMDYIQTDLGNFANERFVHRFNEISLQYSPENQWGMFNLLSSHDTARLITVLKNDQDRYKLGMTMMFLNPGSTSTYYGEEIGLEGEHDPDNRRPMPWGESRIDFIPFFKSLIKEREIFVNTSSVFDRFVASLINDDIVIQNSTNKVTISGTKIKREGK